MAWPIRTASRTASPRYDLDRVFGAFDDFIDAGAVVPVRAICKYEIESMRAACLDPGLCHHRADRRALGGQRPARHGPQPARLPRRFADINADIVIVPRLHRHAVYAGGTVPLSLKLATGGRSVPAGATLTWSLDGATGTIPVPAAEPLSVADLGVTDIAVGGSARVAKIELRLDAAGQFLARNEILVSVYEPRRAATATIAAADPELAAYAEGLGYTVTDAAAADLVLTHALDASDIEAMRQGRRYLVLADGSVETNRNLRTDPPGAEPPTMPASSKGRARHLGAEGQLPNMGLVLRDGTLWRGDWIANFSWLRRTGAFAPSRAGRCSTSPSTASCRITC